MKRIILLAMVAILLSSFVLAEDNHVFPATYAADNQQGMIGVTFVAAQDTTITSGVWTFGANCNQLIYKYPGDGQPFVDDPILNFTITGCTSEANCSAPSVVTLNASDTYVVGMSCWGATGNARYDNNGPDGGFPITGDLINYSKTVYVDSGNWASLGTGRADGGILNLVAALGGGPSNTAPEITTPEMIPSTIYNDTTLNCSTTYTDAEADLGNVTFRWFNNTALVSALSSTIADISNGTEIYPTTLVSPPLGAGSSWICEACPIDNQSSSGTCVNSTARIVHSPPIIANSAPPDYDHNDSTTLNFTFTYAHPDGNQSNCGLIIDGTNYGNATAIANTTTGVVNSPALTDGNLSWYYTCCDLNYCVDSPAFSYILDTTKPTITQNTPAANNESIFYKSIGHFTTHTTCTDNNLFRMNVNITNSSGSSVGNWSVADINSTSHTVEELFNYTAFGNGTYFFNVTCADDHTKNNWNPSANIQRRGNGIHFVFDDDDDIDIEFEDFTPANAQILSFYETKTPDRYILNGEFNQELSELVVRIQADNIVYRPYSEYSGHIIISNKYWFDLEPYQDVDVLERSSTMIKFRINNFNSKYFTSESLGGLNEITQITLFEIELGSPPTPFCSDCRSFLHDVSGIFNFSFMRYSTMNVTEFDIKNEFPFDICYQPTANESSGCGGKETGKYNVLPSEVAFWNNVSSISDNNWSSYAYRISGSPNFYINYSLSYGATAATWEVKDDSDRINYTIPSACFKEPIELRVQSRFVATTNWYCWNTTDWHLIRNDGFAFKIYEEAMWWNQGQPRNISIYLNDTLVFNYNDTLHTNVTNITLPLGTMQTYMDDCIVANGRNCDIPVNITWEGGGTLNISYSNMTLWPWRLSYVNSILGGGAYDYVLQLNVDSGENSTAKIWLNNTEYNATSKTILPDYLNQYLWDDSIPILGTPTATIPFYWEYEINYSNGTQLLNNITQTYHQEYGESALFLCNATSNVTTINISLFDEITLVNTTGRVEVSFEMWINDKEIYQNVSFDLQNDDTYQICISPANSTIFTDALMLYSKPGFNTRTYYLINASLSNITNQVDLFYLNGSGERITFTVSSEDDDKLEDIYVKALRFYPNESLYRTVEIGKTDPNGQTALTLERYGPFYKFIFQQDDRTLRETDKDQVYLTSVFYTITTVPDFLQQYNQVETISYGCTFNNATRTFSFSFNDETGVALEGCLDVVHRTALRDTVLSSKCVTTSSGVIEYELLEFNQSGTFFGNCYIKVIGQSIDRVFLGSVEYYYKKAYETFGLTGVLLTIIIVGTMAAIGFFNPAVGVLLSLVGLAVSLFLGLTFISWGILVVLFIIGGILIFKLKT